MEKVSVTTKGQVVIPSRIRRKFGIVRGSKVFVYERDGEIIVKPITDEFIEGMAGMAGTKGRLMKALEQEKRKERLL
jgi:AbrB family looped-hinge helix DNA binding protein